MPTAVMQPYFQQLARLKQQATAQAKIIVNELKGEIIPYITERQLFDRGIDGQGKRLKPYSPFTIAIKKQKGEVYNRTTLLDTGDFYEGFTLIAQNDEMIFYSSDYKTPELVSKYGKDIFTLTVEHNTEINDKIILPRLIEWLLNSIEI